MVDIRAGSRERTPTEAQRGPSGAALPLPARERAVVDDLRSRPHEGAEATPQRDERSISRGLLRYLPLHPSADMLPDAVAEIKRLREMLHDLGVDPDG